MSEYCVNCEESGRRITELEAENADLSRRLELSEGDLWTYGDHLPCCSRCDCGWAEIVERLEKKQGGEQ